MFVLAAMFGLLHTVDWPKPSRESRTHQELLSMKGLSALTLRNRFLHISLFAWVLTSFSLCLRTVKVLFGYLHRHLWDVLKPVPLLEGGLSMFLVSLKRVRAQKVSLAYPGVLRLIGTDERRVLHFVGTQESFGRCRFSEIWYHSSECHWCFFLSDHHRAAFGIALGFATTASGIPVVVGWSVHTHSTQTI